MAKLKLTRKQAEILCKLGLSLLLLVSIYYTVLDFIGVVKNSNVVVLEIILCIGIFDLTFIILIAAILLDLVKNGRKPILKKIQLIYGLPLIICVLGAVLESFELIKLTTFPNRIVWNLSNFDYYSLFFFMFGDGFENVTLLIYFCFYIYALKQRNEYNSLASKKKLRISSYVYLAVSALRMFYIMYNFGLIYIPIYIVPVLFRFLAIVVFVMVLELYIYLISNEVEYAEPKKKTIDNTKIATPSLNEDNDKEFR